MIEDICSYITIDETIDLPRFILSNNDNHIYKLQSIGEDNFSLVFNGKNISLNDVKKYGNVVLQVNYKLKGGKGGFGALLKAFRISKSSNQRDSRDLSGRRISDIEEEKRILKWIEGQSKRELEAAKKKLAKYVKCKNSLEGVSKHKINNDKYLKVKALIDRELNEALKESEDVTEENIDKDDDKIDNSIYETEEVHKSEEDKNESDSDCDFDINAGPNSFGKKKIYSLKCHALVKNLKNITKYHTDEGEDCTALSKYCFILNGKVNSVDSVYVAGCDELLGEFHLSDLGIQCTFGKIMFIKIVYTLSFIFIISTVNCLICERYFTGIPFSSDTKVKRENVTCKDESAYCVNASTKFLNWNVIVKGCNNENDLIQKVVSSFDGNEINNNTCYTTDKIMFDITAKVCTCNTDLCNSGSVTIKKNMTSILILFYIYIYKRYI
uniref:Replication stress response regulator SDE2 n=1 Tax=Parastrongyloides trichosuri TaxID=131310 RepID=A0A0N4ZQG4_PARTI